MFEIVSFITLSFWYFEFELYQRKSQRGFIDLCSAKVEAHNFYYLLHKLDVEADLTINRIYQTRPSWQVSQNIVNTAYCFSAISIAIQVILLSISYTIRVFSHLLDSDTIRYRANLLILLLVLLIIWVYSIHRLYNPFLLTTWYCWCQL